MSKLNGRFYVPDARQTTDAKGRKVISDQAFVSENKITTVFGLAADVGPTLAAGAPSGPTSWRRRRGRETLRHRIRSRRVHAGDGTG